MANQLAEVAKIPKVGKKYKKYVRPWRPHSLLSCLGQDLKRTIVYRIVKMAITFGVLSTQHGETEPKRPAIELVAAFTDDVEEAFSRGQNVAMATMNVQDDFGALLRNRLLHSMRDQGWNTPAIRMIDCFLSD